MYYTSVCLSVSVDFEIPFGWFSEKIKFRPEDFFFFTKDFLFMKFLTRAVMSEALREGCYNFIFNSSPRIAMCFVVKPIDLQRENKHYFQTQKQF